MGSAQPSRLLSNCGFWLAPTPKITFFDHPVLPSAIYKAHHAY
jgi:hypothetical protein